VLAAWGIAAREIVTPRRQLLRIFLGQALERSADMLVGDHARDSAAALDLLFDLFFVHDAVESGRKSELEKRR
jgi:hypothetical protein